MNPLQFNLEDRSPFDRRFFISKDARLPDIQVQLLDGTDPVNLTGATVTFSMQDLSGVVKVNATAAILVTPLSGIVGYAWLAADTDTVGVFKGQFVATIGGKEYKIPNNTDQTLIITIGERIN